MRSWALDRNGDGRLVSIDPEPRADVSAVAHERYPMPLQDVPTELFERLGERSVLFIDSSHRVGSGSDVNRLFLEILPALRPGVLIHVHDIYLPEDYPAFWNVDEKWNYTEQYLLHALLTHSRAFRPVWPGRYVMRTRGPALASLFPSPDHLGLTCSFWLERV